MMNFIRKSTLDSFLCRLRDEFPGAGNVYLLGETSLVFEGWLDWTSAVEWTSEIAEQDRPAFAKTAERLLKAMGLQLIDESPGALIPLPKGYENRARPIQITGCGAQTGLSFFHFDPYSVAFRYIARGDLSDYQLVIAFLQQGWVTEQKMNALLEELLPRFSFKTIQQDPAEFRRKYKGLLQMWHAQEKATTGFVENVADRHY